jgi:hypothetical protein
MNETIPFTLGQRVGVRWAFDGSGVEMRFAGQVVSEVPTRGAHDDTVIVEVDPLVSDTPLRDFEVFEAKGNRYAVVPVEKVSDAGQPARVASFGWLD